jgi:Arc/MetJ family transcription regulator
MFLPICIVAEHLWMQLMRISIDIDDRLLQQAMRLSGNRTKEETVEAALRLLIEVDAQTSIRRLRGKVQWQGIASDRPRTAPRNLSQELMEGLAAVRMQRSSGVSLRGRNVRPRADKTGKGTTSSRAEKSR